VERIADGQPQHPVGQALQALGGQFNLPKEQLLEIIDGMEMDLDQNRYRDFKELQLYCYRVASVVGLLSAAIFGYRNRKTLKYAHDLGLAFQLTNIVRDVGEDARRGRIYLPLEEMANYGVTEQDILQGRESANVRRLLAMQIERARHFYERAFAELPPEDRKLQRTGLVMAAIYRTLLDEIERGGCEKVLNQRISLTPIRKLWLAWRTWIFS